MIRALGKLVRWLEARFPAKVIVTDAEYTDLKLRIVNLEYTVKQVQQSAVHKEAVQDLIRVIEAQKADLASFKVSLGMSKMANPDLSMVLNGDFIGAGNV